LQHLLRLGRRAGDDRLRPVGQNDQREAVAGGRRLDRFRHFLDGVLEPRGVAGVPGGHAQRRIKDDDAVRPRGVDGDFERPRQDRLPSPLRPRRRRDHPGQRQEQRKHPRGEQQPAIDALTLPLLGDNEEACRRPLDNLQPLPAEQVNEDWHGRRDRRRPDGDSGQGERGEQDHGPLREAST
jgi:hypothetical protein